MQKVRNVIRGLIIFAVFYLNAIHIFSQEKISGKFAVSHKLINIGTNYNFKKDGTFTTENFDDLGIESFGEGHYLIKNDILILNYDLTELKNNSYHKYKYYKNANDSIQIRIKIYNFYKKELKNISVVGNIKENYGVLSNQNGLAVLKFKKRKGKIKINISDLCCGKYSFFIKTDFNYEVDVFLRESFNNPTAIKNQREIMKILEYGKNFIKVKTDTGIKTWIRN